MRLTAALFIAPIALAAPLFFSSPSHARTAPKAAVAPAKVAPDAVLAPAWILMDPSSGRILKAKNPHARMFPASTTKTMTALLAVESGKLDEIVTIGPNPPKTGEQSINLMQGEQFVLRDLVRAALIKSANDACVAIAEAVAGDVPSFAKMMNEKARQLGAKDTNFVNPHGLHDPNHYSTAYDLALIARAAMAHPEFNEITKTKRTQIHGNPKIGALRPLLNRNRLLFRWAQCDGVKTGYTKQAGRCLIASATQIDPTSKKPWRLLSVVLKSPNSWQDSRNLLALQGFAKFQPIVVAKAGEAIAQGKVKGGAAKVQGILAQDALLTLRKDEKSALTRQAQFFEISAPVQAGQVVGALDYFALGHKVASLPLVAREAVPVSRFAAIVGTAPKFPLSLAIPALLVAGVTMLVGGWKLQSNEKRNSTARRQAHAGKYNSRSAPNTRPQIRPDARPGGPSSAQRGAGRDLANPTTAGQTQRAVRRSLSLVEPLPARAATADGQTETRSDKEPCLGEQFVSRFLAEEAETRDFASAGQRDF